MGIQFIEDEDTHELKAIIGKKNFRISACKFNVNYNIKFIKLESPNDNDIHTVVIDDRHSQYFMTNRLWELSTGS